MHSFILVREGERPILFARMGAMTHDLTSAATIKFIEEQSRQENDAVILGRLPTILETRHVVSVK